MEFHNGEIRQKRFPFPGQTTSEQQRDVILGIAIRRDHHTRYARHREFQRKYGEPEKRKKVEMRLRRLSRAVVDITQGKHESVEKCLAYHDIDKVGSYAVKELEQLWGIKNALPKE